MKFYTTLTVCCHVHSTLSRYCVIFLRNHSYRIVVDVTAICDVNKHGHMLLYFKSGALINKMTTLMAFFFYKSHIMRKPVFGIF